ncbi:uncharacterized protein PHALS_09661 [Plasmopara halstedii]|uniref:Uncharacterized protein n=1 Tax=Plasmopara halstedii TaxID=4781 RepID=A0A0P1AFB4_PLAHL|nr:uncharacterized protein PHALS_09661 [Plasmopara halstedii]CEG39412.1 hypothetical protein PHALS_09661 [Plasmopara halstedii]|eukprot:XP_024575781.1 hypothetical protein PHALS_09661 [Plasmopara halstedii]
MQWTDELNALLNQCVFACSYDFKVSCDLFCQQVAKLRLWHGNEALELTANQCQEQWMVLNPVEEDEDGEESRNEEIEKDKSVNDTQNEGPRLELLLSDAELDELLMALPRHEEQDRVLPSSASDVKDRKSSEMQWVLAFLTDPDAIDTVDIEAKYFIGSREHHNDDNYQNFLQDLHKANLLVPPPPITAVDRRCNQQLHSNVVVAQNENQDGGEDQEEWECTRHAIKHLKKFC